MNVLALVLAAVVGQVDTVPPFVQFPDPGLDDPAAYEGYVTRVFRDVRGNALQVYLNESIGRVVHVWADAANESVAFTVRDSSGRPPTLRWASSGAAIGASGSTRSVSYRLEVGPTPCTIGLVLLGSMRVERDFQYQGRDTLPLDSVAFVHTELLDLIANVGRLASVEQQRHLALLQAGTVGELRARLDPSMSESHSDASWTIRMSQPAFDGRSHLWLELRGESSNTAATRVGRTVTIRSRGGATASFSVRITTDAPALTPLTRAAIFNDAFRRFYTRVAADTAHPLRLRRIEREVRGAELLTYREKQMAGLPNFATYFGRDMLMTALLMESVWSDTMAEYVIAAALAKLAPSGEVSHEEALGGQAIRENAARYNRLVVADSQARARAVLGALAAVRENYLMVDDDFQLPVVAARYLANPAVPSARKVAFLKRWRAPLVANLTFVARSAAAYAASPKATNLVSFRRLDDGWWHAGSWRDSRVGYAGGRFAMDVNVIWVPAALRAIGTIDSVFQALGLAGVPNARDVAAALPVWRTAVRHFDVTLAPAEVEARVRAKLSSLPADERTYWETALSRTGFPRDTLRFPALSLDADGQPIPVLSTDPAMLLLLEALTPAREAELLRPCTLAYPVGLLVDGVGPVAANDAYAPRAVWDMFERDRYHSPRVVWGREVNVLLAVLARRGAPWRATLDTILGVVARSGLQHAELWSYRIAEGRLRSVRYGSSSDVQLWSLTDLAVQFLRARPPGEGL